MGRLSCVPPRAGRPKRRRACRGRSVAPVPLKRRSARVAGAGSRVWACARCRPWSSHYSFQLLCAPSRSRRMLSHARSPPPPPCAFRYSSRARWQWVILLHRNASPLLVGTAPSGRVSGPSRTPSSNPPVRKTPDGPETRPDGWFRRAKGGGRPSQVLCGPAGPHLTEIHQPSAPRDPRTLATVQAGRDARRGISPFSTFRIDTCKSLCQTVSR